MGKIYINPFNWGYVEDNTLIYENPTDEAEVKEMIDQALSDAVDDIVGEAVNSMDIKLEGENLKYKLVVNGNENGEIDIPKDQFLKSVTYDKDNKQLIFVMETSDGEATTEVAISDLVASIEDGVGEIQGMITEINNKNDEQDSALDLKADASALAEKADKSELQAVEAKVDAIDLTPYATKADVEESYQPKGDYLTEHQDLSEYAKSADVQSALDLKADKTEVEVVDAKVEAIVIPDVSGFATKEELSEVETALNEEAQRATSVEGELQGKDTELQANIDTLSDKVDAIVIPDVSGFATKTEVEEGYQPKGDYLTEHQDLSDYAKTADVQSALDLKADKTEVEAVDAKVEAIDLTPYATKADVQTVDDKVEAIVIPDVSGFAVKSEVSNEINAVSDALSQFETQVEAALDLKADVSALVDLATKSEVESAAANAVAQIVANAPEDFDTLKEVANYIDSDKTKAAEIENKLAELTAKDAELVAKDEAQDTVINGKVDRNMNGANGKALIFNESDGGGAKFEHNDGTWSFAGVNDGGENGIAGQIYAVKKNAEGKMEGTRIDVTKGAMYYTVGAASAAERIVADNEIAVKGDVKAVNDKVDALEIPSIEGLAKSADVTAEIAAAVSVLNTKDEEQDAEIALKADSDKVYTKEDVNNTLEGYVPVEQYNDLKARLDNLEIMMSVYNAEREAQMDEIISNMSSDNKELVIDTLMESIVVPETTVAYTITAPLTDNSTVELTSPKYMTLINTSKEPVSTTISHEYAEGETTSATSVYLVGDFDTLTIENISPSVKSGYDAASVKNVVIPETNVKNLSLSLDFQDGATITNNSDKDITIYDKSDSEIALTIVAPNSTVTLSGGQFTTLNAEVSDNTLIIKKNVHIDNLNLAKGNAIVEVARAEEVAGIVENYTVADGYSVSHRIYHITNENSSKLGGVGEMILDDDITRTASVVAPLAPAYDAVWNLNGHNITVEGEPKSGVYLNRYASNLEVKGEGVIRAEGSYGLWNNGTTGKIIINDGVTIEAQTHAVYAEKGVIEINGGTFKLTNWADAEKDENGNLKFLINCYDANYKNGSANIIVRGGKFYDFNPAESYGEPNGPVSFIADGYGSVMTTETIDGVEHKVYEVKPING